jgi:rod shape-determining protein MreC
VGGSFRADRFGTRADTIVFVACVALSLTALALPEGVRAPVAGALRRMVLLPLLELQQRAVLSAEARQSLTSLVAQRDSLSLRAASLPVLAAENARLRGLLRLGGRLGTGFVPAEILHQSGVTDGLTLVLSAGREAGVQQLDPIVTAEGLLGIVLSVDPRTSVALAWSHPDFRASAMVEDRQVFGIVAARHGERSGEVMELRGVRYRDVLAPGTRVVTAGLGVFPRGIPVGTVERVLSESAGWQRTYLLRPAVHPAQASHALILSLSQSPDALTGMFADSLAGEGARSAPSPPPPRR